MSKSYIKCPKCNMFNLNQEYCSHCGTLLNVVLKRQMETEKKNKAQIEQRQKTKKPPSKAEAFFNKGLAHSNILVRVFFKVIYSIWIFFAVLMAGLIAAVTAAAAG